MVTRGSINGYPAEVINDSGAEANVMSITLAAKAKLGGPSNRHRYCDPQRERSTNGMCRSS
jgi:hypothetical protein